MALARLKPTERPPFLPGTARLPVAGGVRAGSRMFLSGANAVRPDGTVAGIGDPAAQAHAAIDAIEAALTEAGGSLKGITRLTTSLVDRDHRKAVYEVIGTRLKDVFPVSTGLIAAGLPRPELTVQIDAEAMIDEPIRRHRTFEMKNWFAQNIAWQGGMLAVSAPEIFVRGQTGSALDGKSFEGVGRRPEDAAAQAELSLANLKTLLGEVGSSLEDVCKITVFITDRAYREAVYPVIGKYFRGTHPVSTGIIIPQLARPELLFEIDAMVIPRQGGASHARIRPYHSKAARYGTEQQALDCDFCMAVRAGRRVYLRGQTGVDLNEVLRGAGDAVAQAEQAMANVETLLGEAGATLADVVKASVYVTDRAFLNGVSAAVLGRLQNTTPAFSALIVKGLASTELVMEVDITAVVPEDRA